MSNAENKNKKKPINKTLTNLKNHDDYNVHDYVLSYDTKTKSSQNNFDIFSENDVKLLFSKKGIHIYDIRKNQFDNRKYNTIQFKIRENEGENNMKEKMKEVENDLEKKNYKVCIEKEIEKEKKRNLRGVVKNPFTKGLMMTEDGNAPKDTIKKKEPHQIKKNSSFSGMFSLVNHKYKK